MLFFCCWWESKRTHISSVLIPLAPVVQYINRQILFFLLYTVFVSLLSGVTSWQKLQPSYSIKKNIAEYWLILLYLCCDCLAFICCSAYHLWSIVCVSYCHCYEQMNTYRCDDRFDASGNFQTSSFYCNFHIVDEDKQPPNFQMKSPINITDLLQCR